ncbi:DnaB-like helicase N-terminal domain-containing protein [Actinokineospora enzanensis]|uniref:DnaB-like helicase N-terminal domain-containing protein n=1 Tax=Actinokineospora enzanensis TaxID=155975 RepID=UPI000367A00D|nr:DnaB-like helicase N-terminal domain-containing protein [Actinokineospora enzanensis]
MADDDPAVTTTEPTAQPVINGFDRLAAATSAPVSDTAPGPPAAERSASEPSASGNAPDAVLGADSARQLLLRAFQIQATGAELDAALLVREALSRDDTQPVATALRALAAEGRARAGVDDETGRMLRDAGVPRIAVHLDAAADGIAAEGIAVPDLVYPGSPERAGAVAVFDALGERLRAMNTAVEPPPANLSAADIPLELQAQHLRSPRGLRRPVQQLLQSAEASQLPADVFGGLAVVDGVLMAAGFEYPAHRLAQQVAGLDRPPLQVAVRVGQIADMLDARLPNDDVQRGALGSYEQGRPLSAQLRAIGADVERIVGDPEAFAQARVLVQLGTIDLRELSQPSPDGSPAPSGAEAAPEPQAETDPEQREVEEDAAAEADPQTATPYRYNPELMPEHALLGSLLNTPAALADLEEFLGARDFSTPDTRAVYTAIRGLHRDGALINVADMSSEARQLEAANENYLKLFTALRADPPPYGRNTIFDIPRLIGQITAAAPAESVPYRGVYDPGAQMRLGRMVLEDSIRRQLGGMGMNMKRATPLVAPAQMLGPQRGERNAQTLVSNLELIESQVDAMAQRLVAAVKHTGPDAVAVAVPRVADETVSQSAAGRIRMPERFRAITAPLQHRAERHIIHLALHAGRMENIPEAVLNLAPEDFSSSRHANTWRTIKDLQARGLPVNYVAVDRESRAGSFAHQPMLTNRALTKMAEPPEIKPERVARSLRTLVSSALARAKTDSQYGIAAVSTGTEVPVESALFNVKKNISGLAERAKTAVQQHREITHQQTHTRNSSSR